MGCSRLGHICVGSQLWHLLSERPLVGHLAPLSLIYKTGMIRTLRFALRGKRDHSRIQLSAVHTVSTQQLWLLRWLKLAPSLCPESVLSPRLDCHPGEQGSLSYPFLWLLPTPLSFQKGTELIVFSPKTPAELIERS